MSWKRIRLRAKNKRRLYFRLRSKPDKPLFMPIIKMYCQNGGPNAIPISSLDADWALHIHQKPLEALAISGGMSPVEIVGNIERLPLCDYHTVDERKIKSIIQNKGVRIDVQL